MAVSIPPPSPWIRSQRTGASTISARTIRPLRPIGSPFSWPLLSTDHRGYLIVTADQEANPETVLEERLTVAARNLPIYPYNLDALTSGNSTWSYGDHFYYGDGSGLMYKADEAASS